MKTSEMIKELQEAINENGDQDLTVIIYGKMFEDIELNAVDDTLYIEAYLPECDEEDFIRKYVSQKDWR